MHALVSVAGEDLPVVEITANMGELAPSELFLFTVVDVCVVL